MTLLYTLNYGHTTKVPTGVLTPIEIPSKLCHDTYRRFTMKRNTRVLNIAISGVLSAIGILIPMIMPIKIVIGSSTYTLASHVPIFVAMFVNPSVGIFVSLTTTLGFFLGGWPLPVVLRALSHILFVIPGALYLKKYELKGMTTIIVFNLIIALIHGLGEFSIISLLNIKVITPELLGSFFLFLGIGTMIHSTVDFFLSLSVVKSLNLHKGLQ